MAKKPAKKAAKKSPAKKAAKKSPAKKAARKPSTRRSKKHIADELNEKKVGILQAAEERETTEISVKKRNIKKPFLAANAIKEIQQQEILLVEEPSVKKRKIKRVRDIMPGIDKLKEATESPKIQNVNTGFDSKKFIEGGHKQKKKRTPVHPPLGPGQGKSLAHRKLKGM